MIASPLLMIELFGGLGGASAEMPRRGWEVIRVELDPPFEAEVTADVREFRWTGRRPDLVWASFPGYEFSQASNSLELAQASIEFVRRTDPRCFVFVSVQGAIPYLRPILGDPVWSAGPFFVWGNIPPLGIKGGKFRKCV